MRANLRVLFTLWSFFLAIKSTSLTSLTIERSQITPAFSPSIKDYIVYFLPDTTVVTLTITRNSAVHTFLFGKNSAPFFISFGLSISFDVTTLVDDEFRIIDTGDDSVFNFLIVYTLPPTQHPSRATAPPTNAPVTFDRSRILCQNVTVGSLSLPFGVAPQSRDPVENVDLVILMDTSSSVSSHDFLVTKLLLSSALENAFPSDDGSSRFGLAFYADEGEMKLPLSQRTSQELKAEMTSDDLSRAVGNAANSYSAFGMASDDFWELPTYNARKKLMFVIMSQMWEQSQNPCDWINVYHQSGIAILILALGDVKTYVEGQNCFSNRVPILTFHNMLSMALELENMIKTSINTLGQSPYDGTYTWNGVEKNGEPVYENDLNGWEFFYDRGWTFEDSDGHLGYMNTLFDSSFLLCAESGNVMVDFAYGSEGLVYSSVLFNWDENSIMSVIPSQSPSTALPSKSPSKMPSQNPSPEPTNGTPTKVPSHLPTTDVPTNLPSLSPTTETPSKSPSMKPSSDQPTFNPTSDSPSFSPSWSPTTETPSKSPSMNPSSDLPTSFPTSDTPSFNPTKSPSTSEPSNLPSINPSSDQPSLLPTSDSPSKSPSGDPTTEIPTEVPSVAPSPEEPSVIPSEIPTCAPSTESPTRAPSKIPTSSPSSLPTTSPSSRPTFSPTTCPSSRPTPSPTSRPSSSPSSCPSESPTTQPTSVPSDSPTTLPSSIPSSSPSSAPSESPSSRPTTSPTTSPSSSPVTSPSSHPTSSPSSKPTTSPSSLPTTSPSSAPTSSPSTGPSDSPTTFPSSAPSESPSSSPTMSPTTTPTSRPTTSPSTSPTSSPSSPPSTSPHTSPSSEPTTSPSTAPSRSPSTAPSSFPSSSPSSNPSSSPSTAPTSSPTTLPTYFPTVAPSWMNVAESCRCLSFNCGMTQWTGNYTLQIHENVTELYRGETYHWENDFFSLYFGHVDHPHIIDDHWIFNSTNPENDIMLVSQVGFGPYHYKMDDIDPYPVGGLAWIVANSFMILSSGICEESTCSPDECPADTSEAINVDMFPTMNPSVFPTMAPTQDVSVRCQCLTFTCGDLQWDGNYQYRTYSEESSIISYYYEHYSTYFGMYTIEKKLMKDVSQFFNDEPQWVISAAGDPIALVSENTGDSQIPLNSTTWMSLNMETGIIGRTFQCTAGSIQCSYRECPTYSPTSSPTTSPSSFPTSQPSSGPTESPSTHPSTIPTASPTSNPTSCPSTSPSTTPTSIPSSSPSSAPSGSPSSAPTTAPTSGPTVAPSSCPSAVPSMYPSINPTVIPTSAIPTAMPTFSPDTSAPSRGPSSIPSMSPTMDISMRCQCLTFECGDLQWDGNYQLRPYNLKNGTISYYFEHYLTSFGTYTIEKKLMNGLSSFFGNEPQWVVTGPDDPMVLVSENAGDSQTPLNTTSWMSFNTETGFIGRTFQCSHGSVTCSSRECPTLFPTLGPTTSPTSAPSSKPSTSPTTIPSTHPTISPTTDPTSIPTSMPSSMPSTKPSTTPTDSPTTLPSTAPTESPTTAPSSVPTANPTTSPSTTPSDTPSAGPSVIPSFAPTSNEPSKTPSILPSMSPSTDIFYRCQCLTFSCGGLQWDGNYQYRRYNNANATIDYYFEHYSTYFGTYTIEKKMVDDISSFFGDEPQWVISSINDLMMLVSQNARDSQTPLSESVWMPFNTETGFIGQGFECNGNSITCSAHQCPTLSPTSNPSSSPTSTPTSEPTAAPTTAPTTQPSRTPTAFPSAIPSSGPSNAPSFSPSSDAPSTTPTVFPSSIPSYGPSVIPSCSPSSDAPSITPSVLPTSVPSLSPSFIPSYSPISSAPSFAPSSLPSVSPTLHIMYRCQCLTFTCGLQWDGNYQFRWDDASNTAATHYYFEHYSASFGMYVIEKKMANDMSVIFGKEEQWIITSPDDDMVLVSTNAGDSQTPLNSTTWMSFNTRTAFIGQIFQCPQGSVECSNGNCPTISPTSLPTTSPSSLPTTSPSLSPSVKPSIVPSTQPSHIPSVCPSTDPTNTPSSSPTFDTPSKTPTLMPSVAPTIDIYYRCQCLTFTCGGLQWTGNYQYRQFSGANAIISYYFEHYSTFFGLYTIEKKYVNGISASFGDKPQWVISSPDDPMILISENAEDSQTPLNSTIWMSFNTDTAFIGQAFQCSHQSVQCSNRQCPTLSPTSLPTTSPTSQPTTSPSVPPSAKPSKVPSTSPSVAPTVCPSRGPSTTPSSLPTTDTPSKGPSVIPTVLPSASPSSSPSTSPTTDTPSKSPTVMPSAQPTTDIYYRCQCLTFNCGDLQWNGRYQYQPYDDTSSSIGYYYAHYSTYFGMYTLDKILMNIISPFFGDEPQWVFSAPNDPMVLVSQNADDSQIPTNSTMWMSFNTKTAFIGQAFECTEDSIRCSDEQCVTLSPTTDPTTSPSSGPTSSPSSFPTSSPSSEPTSAPSSFPTSSPSSYPTTSPSSTPTVLPSSFPTVFPTILPSGGPSTIPSFSPISSAPSQVPSLAPSVNPTIDISYRCQCLTFTCGGLQWEGNYQYRQYNSNDAIITYYFEHYSTFFGQYNIEKKYVNGISASFGYPPQWVISSPNDPMVLISANAGDSQTPLNSTVWMSFNTETAFIGQTFQCSDGSVRYSTEECVTLSPTTGPTSSPTSGPTSIPSSCPTSSPSTTPTSLPSTGPSSSPSSHPTTSPSTTPTAMPSSYPSAFPTASPSLEPSTVPSFSPFSSAPSHGPSLIPSVNPTIDISYRCQCLTFTCGGLQWEGNYQYRQDSSNNAIISYYFEHYSTFFGLYTIEKKHVNGISASFGDQPQWVVRSPDDPMILISENAGDSQTPLNSTIWMSFNTETAFIGQMFQCSEGSVQYSSRKCPTLSPTSLPTTSPTSPPTISPSVSPSIKPSTLPSTIPSVIPSVCPSEGPSTTPSSPPTTDMPSVLPTTDTPSKSPSVIPSVPPTTDIYYRCQCLTFNCGGLQWNGRYQYQQYDDSNSSISYYFEHYSTYFGMYTLEKTLMNDISPFFGDEPQWVISASNDPMILVSKNAADSQIPLNSTTWMSYNTKTAFIGQAFECSQGSVRCSNEQCVTLSPTTGPTSSPSSSPTSSPSSCPTSLPSSGPTSSPSTEPTPSPSSLPTVAPSLKPSNIPSYSPISSSPSQCPSLMPSVNPTVDISYRCQCLTFVCGGLQWEGNYQFRLYHVRNLIMDYYFDHYSTYFGMYTIEKKLMNDISSFFGDQPQWVMSSFNDPMILVSENAGDSQTPLNSTVWMSFNTETGFIGQAFQCPENSVSCSANQCPTLSPTSNPSSSPTTTPSSHPSSSPTTAPSSEPTISPTTLPTSMPTTKPSSFPSASPSTAPSSSPSSAPTVAPTLMPSTTTPSTSPSANPSATPSAVPSSAPLSSAPSLGPSITPSTAPTTDVSVRCQCLTFDCSGLQWDGNYQYRTYDGHHEAFSYYFEHYSTYFGRYVIEKKTISELSVVFGEKEQWVVTAPDNPVILISENAGDTQHPMNTTVWMTFDTETGFIGRTFECSDSSVICDGHQCPTLSPSTSPTTSPTPGPTTSPTSSPSSYPTSSPSTTPSISPTSEPSSSPTISPSTAPSSSPTTEPSTTPSTSPTSTPSISPSTFPTSSPSTSPSITPSSSPSTVPTISPTTSPSTSPTTSPSTIPSSSPTTTPTTSPVTSPSTIPSSSPTTTPSTSPVTSPTSLPSELPTTCPTTSPVTMPTANPTTSPSSRPSSEPTSSPSDSPTSNPSSEPTQSPSTSPTSCPSKLPSSSPTSFPSTSLPSSDPSTPPTIVRSQFPTVAPTTPLSQNPSTSPSSEPSTSPTVQPTTPPTAAPSTGIPSVSPIGSPSRLPSHSPTITLAPTASPSILCGPHFYFQYGVSPSYTESGHLIFDFLGATINTCQGIDMRCDPIVIRNVIINCEDADATGSVFEAVESDLTLEGVTVIASGQSCLSGRSATFRMTDTSFEGCGESNLDDTTIIARDSTFDGSMILSGGSIELQDVNLGPDTSVDISGTGDETIDFSGINFGTFSSGRRALLTDDFLVRAVNVRQVIFNEMNVNEISAPLLYAENVTHINITNVNLTDSSPQFTFTSVDALKLEKVKFESIGGSYVMQCDAVRSVIAVDLSMNSISTSESVFDFMDSSIAMMDVDFTVSAQTCITASQTSFVLKNGAFTGCPLLFTGSQCEVYLDHINVVGLGSIELNGDGNERFDLRDSSFTNVNNDAITRRELQSSGSLLSVSNYQSAQISSTSFSDYEAQSLASFDTIEYTSVNSVNVVRCASAFAFNAIQSALFEEIECIDISGDYIVNVNSVDEFLARDVIFDMIQVVVSSMKIADSRVELDGINANLNTGTTLSSFLKASQSSVTVANSNVTSDLEYVFKMDGGSFNGINSNMYQIAALDSTFPLEFSGETDASFDQFHVYCESHETSCFLDSELELIYECYMCSSGESSVDSPVFSDMSVTGGQCVKPSSLTSRVNYYTSKTEDGVDNSCGRMAFLFATSEMLCPPGYCPDGCIDGREGLLCGKCAGGHGQGLNHAGCGGECDHMASFVVIGIIFSGLVAAFFLFMSPQPDFILVIHAIFVFQIASFLLHQYYPSIENLLPMFMMFRFDWISVYRFRGHSLCIMEDLDAIHIRFISNMFLSLTPALIYMIYLRYSENECVQEKPLQYVYFQYAVVVFPVILANVIEAENCVEVEGEKRLWWSGERECGLSVISWEFFILYIPLFASIITIAYHWAQPMINMPAEVVYLVQKSYPSVTYWMVLFWMRVFVILFVVPYFTRSAAFGLMLFLFFVFLGVCVEIILRWDYFVLGEMISQAITADKEFFDTDTDGSDFEHAFEEAEIVSSFSMQVTRRKLSLYSVIQSYTPPTNLLYLDYYHLFWSFCLAMLCLCSALFNQAMHDQEIPGDSLTDFQGTIMIFLMLSAMAAMIQWVVFYCVECACFGRTKAGSMLKLKNSGYGGAAVTTTDDTDIDVDGYGGDHVPFDDDDTETTSTTMDQIEVAGKPAGGGPIKLEYIIGSGDAGAGPMAVASIKVGELATIGPARMIPERDELQPPFIPPSTMSEESREISREYTPQRVPLDREDTEKRRWPLESVHEEIVLGDSFEDLSNTSLDAPSWKALRADGVRIDYTIPDLSRSRDPAIDADVDITIPPHKRTEWTTSKSNGTNYEDIASNDDDFIPLVSTEKPQQLNYRRSPYGDFDQTVEIHIPSLQMFDSENDFSFDPERVPSTIADHEREFILSMLSHQANLDDAYGGTHFDDGSDSFRMDQYEMNMDIMRTNDYPPIPAADPNSTIETSTGMGDLPDIPSSIPPVPTIDSITDDLVGHIEDYHFVSDPDPYDYPNLHESAPSRVVAINYDETPIRMIMENYEETPGDVFLETPGGMPSNSQDLGDYKVTLGSLFGDEPEYTQETPLGNIIDFPVLTPSQQEVISVIPGHPVTPGIPLSPESDFGSLPISAPMSPTNISVMSKTEQSMRTVQSDIDTLDRLLLDLQDMTEDLEANTEGFSQLFDNSSATGVTPMSGVTPMGPKSDSSTKRFIQDIMEQHAVGLDNMTSPLSHDGGGMIATPKSDHATKRFIQDIIKDAAGASIEKPISDKGIVEALLAKTSHMNSNSTPASPQSDEATKRFIQEIIEDDTVDTTTENPTSDEDILQQVDALKIGQMESLMRQTQIQSALEQVDVPVIAPPPAIDVEQEQKRFVQSSRSTVDGRDLTPSNPSRSLSAMAASRSLSAHVEPQVSTESLPRLKQFIKSSKSSINVFVNEGDATTGGSPSMSTPRIAKLPTVPELSYVAVDNVTVNISPVRSPARSQDRRSTDRRSDTVNSEGMEPSARSRMRAMDLSMIDTSYPIQPAMPAFIDSSKSGFYDDLQLEGNPSEPHGFIIVPNPRNLSEDCVEDTSLAGFNSELDDDSTRRSLGTFGSFGGVSLEDYTRSRKEDYKRSRKPIVSDLFTNEPEPGSPAATIKLKKDKKVRMQEQPGSMTASELGMEWTNWLGKEKGGEVGEGKAFSNYVEKRVKRKKKNKTRIVDRPNLSDIFKSFDDEGEEEETSERVEPPVKRRAEDSLSWERKPKKKRIPTPPKKRLPPLDVAPASLPALPSTGSKTASMPHSMQTLPSTGSLTATMPESMATLPSTGSLTATVPVSGSSTLQNLARAQFLDEESTKLPEILRDAPGTMFDFGVNYTDDESVIITREGLEQVIGDQVNAICFLDHLEMTHQGLHLKGKLVDRNGDYERNIMNELVEALDNGSLPKAIALGLRMKKLPSLEIHKSTYPNSTPVHMTSLRSNARPGLVGLTNSNLMIWNNPKTVEVSNINSQSSETDSTGTSTEEWPDTMRGKHLRKKIIWEVVDNSDTGSKMTSSDTDDVPVRPNTMTTTPRTFEHDESTTSPNENNASSDWHSDDTIAKRFRLSSFQPDTPTDNDESNYMEYSDFDSSGTFSPPTKNSGAFPLKTHQFQPRMSGRRSPRMTLQNTEEQKKDIREIKDLIRQSFILPSPITQSNDELFEEEFDEDNSLAEPFTVRSKDAFKPRLHQRRTLILGPDLNSTQDRTELNNLIHASLQNPALQEQMMNASLEKPTLAQQNARHNQNINTGGMLPRAITSHRERDEEEFDDDIDLPEPFAVRSKDVFAPRLHTRRTLIEAADMFSQEEQRNMNNLIKLSNQPPVEPTSSDSTNNMVASIDPSMDSIQDVSEDMSKIFSDAPILAPSSVRGTLLSGMSEDFDRKIDILKSSTYAKSPTENTLREGYKVLQKKLTSEIFPDTPQRVPGKINVTRIPGRGVQYTDSSSEEEDFYSQDDLADSRSISREQSLPSPSPGPMMKNKSVIVNQEDSIRMQLQSSRNFRVPSLPDEVTSTISPRLGESIILNRQAHLSNLVASDIMNRSAVTTTTMTTSDEIADYSDGFQPDEIYDERLQPAETITSLGDTSFDEDGLASLGTFDMPDSRAQSSIGMQDGTLASIGTYKDGSFASIGDVPNFGTGRISIPKYDDPSGGPPFYTRNKSIGTVPEDQVMVEDSSGHTSEYVTKNIESEFLSSTTGEDKQEHASEEDDSSTPSFASKPSHLSYQADFELVFEQRPLGLRVRPADNGRGVVVSSFKNKNLGRDTMLEIGCRILTVNTVSVENMSYEEFKRIVQAASMPVTMQFRLPYDDADAQDHSDNSFLGDVSRVVQEQLDQTEETSESEFMEMCKVLAIFVNGDKTGLLLELLIDEFGQKFETLRLLKEHTKEITANQIEEYFTTREGEPDLELLDQVMTALQQYEQGKINLTRRMSVQDIDRHDSLLFMKKFWSTTPRSPRSPR